MSNKRYYWLKLKEDFFESDTMTWLEEQPNGKDYSLLYLKLCLKSIKTNGVLIRKVGQMLMPYDAQTLSKLTNTDHDTVLVAMELYKRIGLLNILENGAIYLPELEQMVGSESKWAKYKRKDNKLEKLQSDSNETPKLIQADIEQDEEKDLEKDSEKKKELDLAFQAVADLYNDICSSLPKVKSITPKRKDAITKLIRLGYTIEDLKTIFSKAENSAFLTGKNKNNWHANFDWLLKEENATKVIEGNYTDHVKKAKKVDVIDNPFLRAAAEMGD